MGIFQTRRNKQFNYTPRYYASDKEGSPFQITHKFDKFRKTATTTKGLKAKFSMAFEDLKHNKDRKVRRRVILIALCLVFIFLYLIEFDLSIFFPPQ